VGLGFARGFWRLVATWQDMEALLRCYGDPT